MLRKFRLKMVAAMVAVAFAGCGGGGGDSTATSQVRTVAAFDYASLDGEYTCGTSTKIKIGAALSSDELSVNWELFNEIVIYKDKVGFLDGFPYYSRNTPLTANAETFFFVDGKLKIVAGPAADVPTLLYQRPKSINDCTRTGSSVVAVNSLQPLYGRLTLNYKFNGGTQVFSESVDFSAANLKSSATLLVGTTIQSSTRAIACSAANINGYTYFCSILDAAAGSNEIFTFNISGKQVTAGLYEYCTAAETATCASDFATSPDGVILATSGILEAGRSFAMSVMPDAEAQLSKQRYASTLPKGNSRQVDASPHQLAIQELLTRAAPLLNPAAAAR